MVDEQQSLTNGHWWGLAERGECREVTTVVSALSRGNQRALLPESLREVATSAVRPLVHTLILVLSSAMLPRHLRRAVVTPAAPAQIRAMLLNRQSLRAVPLALHPAVSARTHAAAFHSSARRQNEAPRSPFQTFVDVLKDELRKNRELQDNVKQLQGDVEKFQDSEAMKRAREAYERARVRSFCGQTQLVKKRRVLLDSVARGA